MKGEELQPTIEQRERGNGERDKRERNRTGQEE